MTLLKYILSKLSLYTALVLFCYSLIYFSRKPDKEDIIIEDHIEQRKVLYEDRFFVCSTICSIILFCFSAEINPE